MLILSHAMRCLLVSASLTVSAIAVANEAYDEEMVVTATREAKAKTELAESIGVIDQAAIDAIGPSHPAEAVNRLPGVHVNNIGGEGHMTAIRHAITTAPVYLFLEDGVPTRPAGFLNHNGLYKVNIQQADSIEVTKVTKGPGTALYVSDAVGGIINSITKRSPYEPELGGSALG